MTWHRHPQLLDRLAGEYAVGMLQGGARRRFEKRLQQDRQLEQRVDDWHRRLGPMLLPRTPVPVSAGLWARIEAQTLPAPAPTAPAPWWQRLFSALPLSTLVAGLALGLVALPLWQALVGPPASSFTQLPESYVGVLANAQGQPGLIVSSLRRGTQVDIKQITPLHVPQGQTLYLWRIDQAGVASPVAALPPGPFVSLALGRSAEQVFQSAVELAVSLEPAGTVPAQPRLPYVARGLCGKLWRVPAP